MNSSHPFLRVWVWTKKKWFLDDALNQSQMIHGHFQVKHLPSAATNSWASSLSRHSTKPAISFSLTACSIQNSYVIFKAILIHFIIYKECKVSYLIMSEVSNQSGLDVWVARDAAENLGTLESSIRVWAAMVQVPMKARTSKISPCIVESETH